jgi:serine/threonine protein phosphatase PrpC
MMVFVKSRSNQNQIKQPFEVLLGKNNELVVSICDGTGSWGYGFEGSRIGANLISGDVIAKSGEPFNRIKDSLQLASDKIFDIFFENDEDIETDASFSATTILIINNLAYIGWAGDVLCFLVRCGKCISKTYPHNLLNDWLRRNEITIEQSVEPEFLRGKSIVTRYLGGKKEPVEIDFYGPLNLIHKDLIVVCSRKILNYISIEEIISRYDQKDVEGFLDRIVEESFKFDSSGEHSLGIISF